MHNDQIPTLLQHVFSYCGQLHEVFAANLHDAFPMAIDFFNPPNGMESQVKVEPC